MGYLCSHCAGKTPADTTHEGLFVRAGFGSRHDTATFIWLARGSDVPTPGILCDSCVDAQVEAGRLEMISTHLGPNPAELSPDARRELFSFAARRTYAAYWEKREEHEYRDRDLDADGHRDILDLRRTMCQDASDPETVGACHAAAALALRLAEGDPGFERAASDWIQGQRARAQEQEDLLAKVIAATT